jgi:hypothetical protein
VNARRIAVLGIFALAALFAPQPALATQPSLITKPTCKASDGSFSTDRGYRMCTYERTSTSTAKHSRTSPTPESISDPTVPIATVGYYLARFTQTNVYSFTETCKQRDTETPVCDTTEPVLISQEVTPTACVVIYFLSLEEVFSLPLERCESVWGNLYAPM